MKKFVFPLQKVLNVRELEEKGKMKELAKAQENHIQEKELLSILQSEEQLAMQSMSGLRSKGVNAGTVRILLNSLEGHRQRVKDQDKKVFEAFTSEQQCRAELLDTTKKKKIMQKLKELDFAKYKDKAQKQEQKLTDEIANVREYRKSNGTES